MVTISLCMIVKNEEDTLGRCLSSAKSVVDDIIIVDTGSEDRTREVAAGFTDKIFEFEWIDNFSAARNYSYEQATMDYILWLDADDIILPEDVIKLKKLKETIQPGTDAIMMRYDTGFDTLGRVTFSCFRERLSKRSRNYKWKEPVHEYLEAGGNRINADVCITHAKPYGKRGERNIRIYENLITEGKELSSRGMYYYARELKGHGRYAEAIDWFSLFLDSGKGWVEDNITACGELANCYLMENKQNEALSAMLYSFNYDTPRAEVCCQIGSYFKEQGRYRQAIFWFELILKLEKDDNNWGFQQQDCWGYIPCIELAVCYDKLGEYEKATLFKEMAVQYKSDPHGVM